MYKRGDLFFFFERMTGYKFQYFTSKIASAGRFIIIILYFFNEISKIDKYR
jgi:hypothetical protein